ncbi:alpha/beta hydrolase family protein [Phytoactinopolyspora mesophila]|uniref:Alpha/beta hydrolase fold domain-containing protein n=1 Tax=Phytoactinopolyspora mesophila TaxID=2650750 RepID=A0A7K3MAD7_9ACTN|nr:alpha/beta hydrolase [Phytoactinopolyspora mesophila]NDL59358.1 alpha/beta hydrolase fold domain-containing protein [Phytoactinopolyspora mesophila]
MSDPRSVLTRPAPPPDLTVSYGPLPDHVADVWLPDDAGPAPLCVVVHGGFWRSKFDRTHTGPQCAAFAAAGLATVSIEYRRTGDGGGWPATFDDVALALDTIASVVSAAAPGRVDTGRVAHVGHSAGGHLAVWAASRHQLPENSRWWRPSPDAAVRGVVSLAGVMDLASAATARLDDGATQTLLGGDPDTVPDRYDLCDPLRLTPPGVPVVLIHGTDDDHVPPEFSHRYAAVAGQTVDLVSLPEIEHFGVIDPMSTAWPVVQEHVSALLRAIDDR